MIAQFVDDLVTWSRKKFFRFRVEPYARRHGIYSRFGRQGRDYPRISSYAPRVHAALATAPDNGARGEAMLSSLDMAASSKPPQRFAETSQPAKALFHDTAFAISADHSNSQILRSSVRQDTQSGGKSEPLGDDANRRQFQEALLENCGFFGDLLLRQVRAGSDPSGGLLERDLSREKLNLVRVSATPPRSKAYVVLEQRPEEPTLPPETPSSLLPTLWVEVGSRHVQTLISEKERS